MECDGRPSTECPPEARLDPAQRLPLEADLGALVEAMNETFEVDAEHVVVAVLAALAEEGKVEPAVVKKAIAELGIDPEAGDPRER
jgi:hypothetical protein